MELRLILEEHPPINQGKGCNRNQFFVLNSLPQKAINQLSALQSKP